jgi:hypothetical protein
MLLIALLTALSACTRPEPGIVVRTVEVPTPVPCVDLRDVPPEPALVGGQLNGQAQHDLLVVSKSALELRRAYREIRALIVPGCTVVATPLK